MAESAIWSSIALSLCGILVGLAFFKWNSEPSWLKGLQASLIGGIAGLALSNSIQCIRFLNEFEPYLERGKIVSDAFNHIDGLKDSTIRSIFNYHAMQSVDNLRDINDNHIYIPRNDVFDTWKQIINGSRSAIMATNVVNASDWHNFDPDKYGIATQRSALERGISIARVMIYHEKDGSRVSLEMLACAQKRALGKKYDVRELNMDNFTNPIYRQWESILNNTHDVVIFDNKAALLTQTNVDSGEIEWSSLTIDPNKIAAAESFFQRVQADSVIIRCKA